MMDSGKCQPEIADQKHQHGNGSQRRTAGFSGTSIFFEICLQLLPMPQEPECCKGKKENVDAPVEIVLYCCGKILHQPFQRFSKEEVVDDVQQNRPDQGKFHCSISQYQPGEKRKGNLKKVAMHHAEQQRGKENGKHVAVFLKPAQKKAPVDEFFSQRRKNRSVQEHGNSGALCRCNSELFHGGISQCAEGKLQEVPEEGVDQLGAHKNTGEKQEGFWQHGLFLLAEDCRGDCFSKIEVEKDNAQKDSGNAGNTALECGSFQFGEAMGTSDAVGNGHPYPGAVHQRFQRKNTIVQQCVENQPGHSIIDIASKCVHKSLRGRSEFGCIVNKKADHVFHDQLSKNPWCG